MKRLRSAAAKGNLSSSRIKRVAAIVLLLALVLSLLPLYSAARFSYPGVDDYRYGLTTHAVWEETHSFSKTVAEAWRVASRTYRSWQGSFAAIFFMALQPGIFGSEWYGLSTVILLTTLVLAIIFFVTTAFRYALHADTDTALIAASVIAIACVQFVPSPVESYYWFNGGVYYTFFFSVSLAAAALLIRRACQGKRAPFFLPPLLLLLGFGNLITGLLCCVLLLAYAVFSNLGKRRDPVLWMYALLLLIGFAINALSPGNGVRQAENAERSQGAVLAILAAMGDACRYAGKWLLAPGTFLMLLPLPLYWRLAADSQMQFRFPLLVSAGSFLLLAAGFTPNEYALGFAGEARIIDIQYYQFILLLALNVLWYVGWAQRHIRISDLARRITAIAVVSASLIAACAITVSTRNMAAASALFVQTGGKAQAYADSWEQRLAILRDEEAKDIVLPKLSSQPPLLCMVDIAPSKSDPFYFYNEQLAAYYGKSTVLREP